MKALKTGLIITLLVSFFIACSEPQSSQNANSNTNQNASAISTVPAPVSVNGNSNESRPAGAYPGATSGETAANANSGAAPGERNKPAPTVASPNVNASALFVTHKCNTCHGDNGKGNPKIKGVPDFTSAEWQKKESDGELAAAIRNGKKPLMPPFADKMSGDEIKAMVAHVRSFAK